MSIAGGIPNAVDRALEVGACAIQIFVKNNNQWKGRNLTPEEAQCFCDRVREERVSAALAHASYLINLASPDDALWHKSIDALVEELRRCEMLQLSHLVVHPGAHVGTGMEAGICRIADALDRVLQSTPGYQVRVTLETTAGQGTSIGHRFEQLAGILDRVRQPERLAVCLDTCHIFAAGYDIRTRIGYRDTLVEFDRTVGLEALQVLHCNDSKRCLGSRVDRHANIGKGKIGLEGFRWFLQDLRLKCVPKILETPKGKDRKGDIRNLRILRSLSTKAQPSPKRRTSHAPVHARRSG